MKKLKRIFLTMVILLTFPLFTGCAFTRAAEASWAFKAINWNHRIYRVTDQVVTSVGEQVTSVTKYSQNEGTPETGTFSNYFPVGTEIFSISGVDVSQAIAIETSKRTFVKAVLDHSY